MIAPIPQDQDDTRTAIAYAMDMRDACARMIARDLGFGETITPRAIALFMAWDEYVDTLFV